MKKKKAIIKNPASRRDDKSNKHSPVIVAIGASAGGIEAISELLKNLSPDTGMAFVYIQHLDPTHASMLSVILSKDTKMKVVEAENMSRILPNQVYVIPPNKDIVVDDGMLKLNSRPVKPALHMPIDRFFMSLAEKKKGRAIGVVLSGNASDGTLGLKAIKIAGGLTFAQDDSAKFMSMPRSAIAEGAVDMVLPPKGIAAELVRLSKQTDVFQAVMDDKEESEVETSDEDLSGILALLRKSTDVDFTHYKINTIKRRIIRRMLLHKLRTLKEYARYLRQHTGEVNTLYQDLLINVTNFFRDAEAMECLKKSVLPRILRTKTSSDPVRVWVPACSTGEEAYSLAILLMEALGDKAANTAVQIFATDLSETAIAKARLGIYTMSELAEVSPRRLQRYFTKVNGSFRIIKSIRDLCVFAPHNVFKDPPFSRLDLVSCCNLLIYLDSSLQKRIIATFHYALNPNGFLILGKSETIGSSSLFTPLDKKVRIYSRKKDTAGKAVMDMTYRISDTEKRFQIAPTHKEARRESAAVADLEKAVDNILLNRYVPASVVVNEDLDIIQFRGSTSSFIEPSPGRASLNLLKMARAGLGFELRSAIHKVSKSGETFRKKGIEINDNRHTRFVNIEVVPLKSSVDGMNYLIVFDEMQPASSGTADPSRISKDGRAKQLELELAGAREDMRSMLEEQEAVNEELQSANEEIVSSNEELQSINEELETSKEEVESSNEELMTINNELQVRNEQLTESNEYSEAMFATLREASLILDEELKVRKANPTFFKIFKVKEEDIEGKSIYKIGNGQWDFSGMHELLDSIIPRESKFNGYEMRHTFPAIGEKILLINAKKISQKRLGLRLLLIAIEDITEHEIGKQIIAEREAWFRNMADNAPALIWVADTDGQRTFFNKTWLDYTGRKMEQETGMGWQKDVHKDDLGMFLQIYNEAFEKQKSFKIEYRLKRKDGEYRWITSRGKPTFDASGVFTGFIGTCTEIHEERERKAELEYKVTQRTHELQETNFNLQSVNNELKQFAYLASHDLQEPLRKIVTFSGLLDRSFKNNLSAEAKDYIGKIEVASQRMRALIEDLLNYSRVDISKHKLVRINLNDVLKETLEDFDEKIKEVKAKITAAKLPEVDGVPHQMKQLFSNLISNALKFKRDGKAPVIDIMTRQLSEKDFSKHPNLDKRRNYTELIFLDNGIGFHQKYAEQAFVIFKRLHNTEKYPGTGIGLALCMKIVTNHGGEIFARAKDGKGTAIHVILPTRGGGGGKITLKSKKARVKPQNT